MNKFGVIGNPVDHSLSPMIHHEFAKEFDIEVSYEKIFSPVDAAVPQDPPPVVGLLGRHRAS